LRQASKFTPAALTVRGSPTDRVTGDFRTEWDPTSHAFLSFAGVGTVNSKHVQASGGWSQQRVVANTPGAVPVVFTHYLNSSVNIRTAKQPSWRDVCVQLRPAQHRVPAAALFRLLQCS